MQLGPQSERDRDPEDCAKQRSRTQNDNFGRLRSWSLAHHDPMLTPLSDKKLRFGLVLLDRLPGIALGSAAAPAKSSRA